MPYAKNSYGIKILLALTFKNVCRAVCIKARVEGVEVFAVKVVLRDADSISESLIVDYFALTQIFYRLFYVRVVNKTQNIIVRHASLLLC